MWKILFLTFKVNLKVDLQEVGFGHALAMWVRTEKLQLGLGIKGSRHQTISVFWPKTAILWRQQHRDRFSPLDKRSRIQNRDPLSSRSLDWEQQNRRRDLLTLTDAIKRSLSKKYMSASLAQLKLGAVWALSFYAVTTPPLTHSAVPFGGVYN